MRNLLAFGLAAGAAAATLSGCAQPKQLFVDKAWVRLGAVPGRPAAAYFVVHGGPAAATLIAVTTDVAVKAEMHESMTANGTASMKPFTSLAIPANTDVPFQPGGRHVMLFDMNPGIKPGSSVTMTFSFGDGTRILQNAGVIGAGAPAPK